MASKSPWICQRFYNVLETIYKEEEDNKNRQQYFIKHGFEGREMLRSGILILTYRSRES